MTPSSSINKKTQNGLHNQFGAGNENRTRIFAMARRYNSRYTIPANVIILYQIFKLKARVFYKKIKFF